MATSVKRPLSFEQIDAQTAVELPDRDMMALINLTVIALNGNEVQVQVPIAVVANVCGVTVAAIAQDVANDGEYECRGDITLVPRQFQ